MSVRYYRVNLRRMSVGECRRLTPDPITFLVALAAKVGLPAPLRIPPAVVPTRWHPADELPDPAARRIRPLADALIDARFRFLGHGRWPVREAGRTICQSLYLSADRVTGASVNVALVGSMTVANIGLTTRFRDGTFGITIADGMHFDPPAEQLLRACPGLPPDDVYPRHLEHLARWEAEGRFPHPFADHEGAVVSVELGRSQADELIERGVYVPMSADEVEDYLDTAGRADS